MLNKLQKQAYRAVALAFAASPEPLSHGLNMFSSSLFLGGNFLSFFYLNWLNWFIFLSLWGNESPFLDVARIFMPKISSFL